jgi:general secretion pathway protein H
MTSRRAGFTLLELLVVLAVIVIAAGLLMPRLDGLGALGVDAAARRLADAAALARDRAILGGRTAHLRLDLDAARWTLDGETRQLGPRVRLHGVTVAGAPIVRSGTVTLDFDPAGSLPARIDLADDRGHAATVVVPPAPARPRVAG